MSILILIFSLVASFFAPSSVRGGASPQPIEQPAEAPLIGFDAKTVSEVKTLFGAFLTEKEGRGGFYFPGVHTKSEVMGELLCNDRRSFESFEPRIELRRTGDLVVQMALAFESLEQSHRFLDYMKVNFPKYNAFEIQEGGGGGIIEMGSKGVNKSTLMNFLADEKELKMLLECMGYLRGRLIDVRQDLSLIVSDANGTIFPQPSATLSFQQSHLKSSKANQSILDYLESGGLLVINSGNEPHRLARKIMVGIPEEKRYLLRNVAIGAAGGHLLFIFNKEGTGVEEYALYRFNASKYLVPNPAKRVQLLYLGDNPKKLGNDWEGFEAAGFQRSICVPHPKNAALVPQELKGRSIVGNDAAVDLVFKSILEEAQAKRQLNQALAFSPDAVSKIITRAEAKHLSA